MTRPAEAGAFTGYRITAETIMINCSHPGNLLYTASFIYSACLRVTADIGHDVDKLLARFILIHLGSCCIERPLDELQNIIHAVLIQP